MLPTPEAFSRDLSALGVDEAMTICIYEQQGVFSAPRAWWMLRTFGAAEVYLLDGGLTAWIDAGLPTSSGAEVRTPAKFKARLNQPSVTNFEQMQKKIANGGQILDVAHDLVDRIVTRKPKDAAGTKQLSVAEKLREKRRQRARDGLHNSVLTRLV